MLGFPIVILAAIIVSGCAATPPPDQTRNILIGAGVGAGVGAIIGSASGGPPGGWAGAAIGAATGGAVGSLVRPEACYMRNRRGEIWQVTCEDRRPMPEACFVGYSPDVLRQVPCQRT
jgi:uncharacterized protein YcfJ